RLAGSLPCLCAHAGLVATNKKSAAVPVIQHLRRFPNAIIVASSPNAGSLPTVQTSSQALSLLGTFDSLRWAVIKPFNQSHSTFQKFVVRNSLPRQSL